MRRLAVIPLAGVVLLSACVTIPTGPSVMVLPGSGKPFEQFQVDDAICRQWAQQQVGAQPGMTANQSTIGGAVIGTLVGAAAGAAIGAAAGNPGAGAAIGAGGGLLGGTAIGASAGSASGYELQRRYDFAYQQCMYAKGNQIPGSRASARPYVGPPPPPPPPPPGAGPALGSPPPPPR